jgi:hypothetical protein
LKLTFYIVLVVILIAALAMLSDNLARLRLHRWAKENGYQLIQFRQAWFWQGPRAWRRTRYQQDYRVVIDDAQGHRRAGWLLGTNRWLGLGSEQYQVQWDNPQP